MVGTGVNAQSISGYIEKHPEYGLRVTGFLTDKDDEIDAIKSQTDLLSFTGNDVKATLDGETVRFIAEMVKRLGAYILGRSIIRREGGKLYNTSFFVDNNGKLIATYDKIHLFGYGSREKELVSRGEEVKVMEMDIGVFGLSTCYDLRFPGFYRIMVGKGAQMFLVVAA